MNFREGRRGAMGAVRVLVALGMSVAATCVAHANDQPPHGIHSLEVPGGVPGALDAIGSPGTPERARFVIELTRRFYNSPRDARESEHPALAALVDRMASFSRVREATLALDPRTEGLSLTLAREKTGNDRMKRWARIVGLELKGGRKAPRLELSRKREAVALRQALAGAGLDLAAVVRALNAGECLAVVLPTDTVPLPLSPDVWTNVIFERQVSQSGLIAAILTTRQAALMYTALLSLDDETRAWMLSHPDLLRQLYRDHAGTFVVAAPALRMQEGRLQLPGGDEARPVWEALAGRKTQEPERFVRAAVERDGGQLAYFLAAMSTIDAAQVAEVFTLGVPGAATPIDSGRTLYSVFGRAAALWDPRARPFWRPPLDPGLLLLELAETQGRPARLPGSRRFWENVLDGETLVPTEREAQQAAGDKSRPTVHWLLDKVFASETGRRERAEQMLFATRLAGELEQASVADAMTTVRAVRLLPALALSLERARLTDVTLLASLARRADDVLAISNETRALVAQAQWQGSLALVLSAALDGGLSHARMVDLLKAFVAIAPDRDGRFEGRLLAWTGSWAPEAQASPVEAGGRPIENAWITMLSGAGANAAPTVLVEWEGARYHVDAPRTVRTRIERVRGPQPRLSVDEAFRLAWTAHRLTDPTLTLAAAREVTAQLTQSAQHLPRPSDSAPLGREFRGQWRRAVNDLTSVTRPRDLRRAADAGHTLTRAADALFAEAVVELAYARVLADHDSATLTPDDAARRHEFGVHLGDSARMRHAWALPVATTSGPGWHVEGSLLGLDVALSSSALRRVSSAPPDAPPTLNDMDRRTFTESVVLMPRERLADVDQNAIAATLTRGRARADEAAATGDGRRVFAAATGIDAVRQSLWGWMLAHEPERAAHWLAPRELLQAGLEGAPMPESWHAWGTSRAPLSGCLCLGLYPLQSFGPYAGHVGGSLIAVAVPDLSLQVALHLAALDMPATLARDVLSAATLDLVTLARSQDHDDWRALVDHVLRVGVEQIEQYLALFTVDGPLHAVDSPATGQP